MATDSGNRDAFVAGPKSEDSKILERIRKRFQYATNAWDEIRKEGTEDIKCLAGDPWDPKDREARDKANRPCLSLDELGQYVNQLINDVRENKRAPKVTAEGNGANDKTAELHAGIIRQIEYRSKAQIAYTSMFEDAVQRSYGFLRINAKYVSPYSFDQELSIEAIPDPNTVTIDPDFISPDASDIKYCFIEQSFTADDFAAMFPDAKPVDFSDTTAPQWIKGNKIRVAEYWEIKDKEETAYLMRADLGALLKPEALTRPHIRRQQATIADPRLPFVALESDLQRAPAAGEYLKTRKAAVPYVCHYLTNGFELLAKAGEDKKTEWPGTTIPLVACFGKVLYTDKGKGSERVLMSLIRLARDPAMLYCYYRTTQAELVSQVPKTPYIGYVGQFKNHEDEWAKVASEPAPYLQVHATTVGTGQTVLPLPQRTQYTADGIQVLDLGAESARRAIQAAIGISPLPTMAQRRNEKSGVALKQIEETGQKGSFHFVDHYDFALMRVGTIIEELIPHYYDTVRDVTIRKPDDSPESVRINDPKDAKDDGSYPNTQIGDHSVTISVGPAYASQRDAANQFADQLAGNPQVFPLIGDLVVKLKDLGPIGDEISERLKALLPPELKAAQGDEKNLPPEAQAAVGQLRMQLQQLQQQLQQAAQALETEQAKQQATIEKAHIERERDIEIQRLKNEAEITIAKINAARAEADTNTTAGTKVLEIAADVQQQREQRGHDFAMGAAGHRNALEQSEQSAVLQQQSQQGDK